MYQSTYIPSPNINIPVLVSLYPLAMTIAGLAVGIVVPADAQLMGPMDDLPGDSPLRQLGNPSRQPLRLVRISSK